MSTLYTARAEFKTAAEAASAGGYSLSSAKVKLGYLPKTASATFLADLAGAGSPFLLIRPGALVADGPKSTPTTLRFDARIWFGIARETADTFANIETFLHALRDRWRDRANFTNTGPAESVTWSEPVLRTKHDPVIVWYDLAVELLGAC